MALSTTDTTITYPDGATTSTGTVLHVEPLSDGRSAVLLDSTAFHPVDTAWPDQPADRGTITTTAGTQPIIDGVTGGIRNGALHLDAALSTAWSKPAPTDALGNPAFDALAIQRSRIDPHRSTDTYRIGKSLRRKGFAPASLDDPSAAAERVNAQLAQWIKAGAPCGSNETIRLFLPGAPGSAHSRTESPTSPAAVPTSTTSPSSPTSPHRSRQRRSTVDSNWSWKPSPPQPESPATRTPKGRHPR